MLPTCLDRKASTRKRNPCGASRRDLLGLAAAAAAASLAGCADWLRREPNAICPLSPELSMRDAPLLTIDSHAHVFNGSDLAVKQFFSMVAVKQGGALGAGAKALGSVLESLAWSVAPDGRTELAQLEIISDRLRSCSHEQAVAHVASMRQDSYATGLQELRAAVGRSSEFKTLATQSRVAGMVRESDEDAAAKLEAIDFINALPEQADELPTLKQRADFAPSSISLKGRSAIGLVNFVLQNLQYRYVSVHDYLRVYNQPGTRVVDLLLPSMVDFDWWLAGGEATPTSLREQVQVMRRIAVLTQGRVHSFVPYDPLRQIAFDLNRTDEDSFTLAKDAVEKHGCVGVKLYPPMGFAALGNAQVQQRSGAVNFWKRDWLPEWTDRADFGQLLDKAMHKVLGWCESNHIPVMAHTNLSNGVTAEFQALADYRYWETALGRYPELRVNFGHFGNSPPGANGEDRSSRFAALMHAGARQPGAFAYADAGYFVEVLGLDPKPLTHLSRLYDDTAHKGDAALANRFLFGTDWEMTLTEGAVDGYLSRFVDLFEQLEARPAMQREGLKDLSARFFGRNAVAWLGLRKNGATRERLEQFYSANRVPQPDWAVKVDKLP